MKKRLRSLDLFRGLTMFLLMGEAAGVYNAWSANTGTSGLAFELANQFHHHPWNGLRFWDLIQPFFMFIVGVAMPFSLKSRLAKGDTYREAFMHILRRCGLLLAFGVGLHCVYSHRLVWELWNVLSQLSFTILVTFLLLRKGWKLQFGVAFLMLLIAEISYRLYQPGDPFSQEFNFGSFTDMLLMNKTNSGGWVAINCISTAAHTIWGAMCGELFLANREARDRIRIFLVAGCTCLLIGYSLDWLQITPIIKRIATTSFVIASAGYCLLTLALAYWLVDVKGRDGKWVTFFVIVGMNPIFIYLFAETVGHQWFNDFVRIFNDGVFGWLGFSEGFLLISNALIVWFCLWYLCYWLYRKGIFFKI